MSACINLAVSMNRISDRSFFLSCPFPFLLSLHQSVPPSLPPSLSVPGGVQGVLEGAREGQSSGGLSKAEGEAATRGGPERVPGLDHPGRGYRPRERGRGTGRGEAQKP